MNRTTHPGVTEIEREFYSWSEFIRVASDDRLRAWPEGQCKSRSVGKDEIRWRGTSTFEEAYDMATSHGWPEGRELMREAFALVVPRPEVYQSMTLDVAGAIPLAPVFATGDPACMMDFGTDVRTARPIVRVDYHSAVLAEVPATSIMIRGAAVLSLARDLEARGYSTELRIVSSAMAYPWLIRVSVIYKEAGEILDLDRAAFALAHPSVQRRFIFSIREQHAEIYPSFRGNYGSSTQEPSDPTSGLPGGAIFITGASVSETPESARLAIEIAAKDLLMKEGKADQ